MARDGLSLSYSLGWGQGTCWPFLCCILRTARIVSILKIVRIVRIVRSVRLVRIV